MNVFADGTPVRGRVDRDGRLIEADPPLAALHARAGGEAYGVIAIPQIAALVRLVRRLGILVSRGVIAADGDRDLDLWVRVQPDGDAMNIAIVSWSERAAAEPYPAAGEDRERQFLDSASNWGWEVDPTLRILALSVQLADELEVDAIAILGEPLTRVFGLTADRTGAMPLIDALATAKPFSGQRAMLRNPEATPAMLAGVPTFRQGRFAGFRGNCVAVAAPPAAPSEDTSDALRSRLDLALRGPVHQIVSQADAIRARNEGPLRRDYAEYAADISTAGRHLLALIDDLADLQAIERPDFTIETEEVDLCDVARRAAGLLAVRAADRNVRIDRPAADDSLPARGDFRRALQILVNLIGNAVRYSPEGSSVWIRCEREGVTATILVADQGKGIAAEDQDRIFAKFERVDPSEPGGTGLGLYISRRLARAMGGDIVVESAPGQGARFTLTLPAAGGSGA